MNTGSGNGNNANGAWAGGIAGGVIGGLALIALVAVGVMYQRRQAEAKANQPSRADQARERLQFQVTSPADTGAAE